MKFFKWGRKQEESAIQESHHDLTAICNQLNHQYFGGKVNIPISWFGKRIPTARRRVRLGTYHLDKKCIKINRLLDHAHIPHFYIAFIIYHEMLHHVWPPIVSKTKRKIHHTRFQEAEKQFNEYDQAVAFGKKNKHLWFAP